MNRTSAADAAAPPRDSATEADNLLDACLLSAFSLVLNLVRIASKSIVHDEAGSVIFARLGFIDLFHAVIGSDPNQSLYYLLLNLWVRVCGESETAVRLPSAIFGALAVGLLCVLGRRLFGRAEALLAGTLLALNSLMVQFSQTARGYSLVTLLVVASSLLFAREVDRPSLRNRLAYAAVSVGAVYAHYLAALVLCAHFLALAVLRRQSLRDRRWLHTAALIAIGCLPAGIVAVGTSAARRIDWIPALSPSLIASVLQSLAGGSLKAFFVLTASGLCGWALKPRSRPSWPYGFVAAWLFTPIALTLLISVFKPMFQANYLIFCVPALVLFGAAGIARLRPRIGAAALVLMLLWASANQLRAFYVRDAPQDWREATRYVLSDLERGDGVVYFPPFAHKAFGYYARRSGVPEPPNLGWQEFATKERIWLVIRASDVDRLREPFVDLQSALRRRMHAAERREFGWVTIELYVR